DPAGAIVPLLSDENRRQRNLLIIAGFLFLVAVANLVDTGVYAPDLPLASNITIFALLNLNLIVLLLLVVLLFRSLVKLWFEQQEQLGISALTVFNAQGQEFVHVKDPVLGDLQTRDVNESQLKRGLAGQEVTTVRELSSGDLIEAFMPIWSQPRGAEPRVAGVVVVATHVSERLEARVRGISQAFQEYKQLRLLRTPIKGIYILLFL